MMERNRRAVWMSERYWRNNRFLRSFALLGVVALAATGTFAVEESAKVSSPGLSGIFPAAPPADLSDEEFAKLNGNWADWSKGAATAVADFYTKLQTANAAEQRQALGVLKVKLDVMRRALDDPRYASLEGPLTALHNSLSMRIDFAEAVLDTLDMDNPQAATEKAKAQSVNVLAAIKALETDLATISNGPLWLPYFKVDELKAALTADPVSANAQAAGKSSKAKLDSRTTLEASQKAFTQRESFNKLASALTSYLGAVNWLNTPDAGTTLRTEIKTLSDSLDTFAATGENASELRKAITTLRGASPDGGDRVMTALQKRLFNYNLRLLVTEDFMNKLMAQHRTESGPVSDYILSAQVSGNQTTDTDVGVDLKPSNTTARFDLVLRGHIQSSTVGVAEQASVWTNGNHTFVATKEVNFDGLKFKTQPATINVSPHNTTTGIATNMSGVPLFGRIAQNVASQEVENRRGQAEAIAASRIREGVLPKFNSEVDSAFATQGSKLDSELFAGLRSTGLFPDTYSYQTSDKLLTVNARLMTDQQLGADLPETSMMTVKGATALLHETVLNNAIDQFGFAGQTLTEPELRQKIEDFLSKALSRPIKFEGPATTAPADGDEEKGPNAIIFAEKDPIRVRVNDGELIIVIRAGFKQEGKDDIPTREVRVPITFEVQGQKLLTKRGNVEVSAADGQGGGISINAVVRKKIQSVLPDRTVDGKIEIKGQQKTVAAYITKVKLSDGWVAVSVE